jgi:aspartyl-tRNA(Asn)/glutamyl-tRNA(Gln) amidotransferase subunit C
MDIDHVALLARLRLSDKEKLLFSNQLGDVLKYIDKLNELNTTSIEPTAHILPIKNVYREDEPKPSPSRDDMLANAPDRADGFYRVPRIID